MWKNMLFVQCWVNKNAACLYKARYLRIRAQIIVIFLYSKSVLFLQILPDINITELYKKCHKKIGTMTKIKHTTQHKLVVYRILNSSWKHQGMSAITIVKWIYSCCNATFWKTAVVHFWQQTKHSSPLNTKGWWSSCFLFF